MQHYVVDPKRVECGRVSVGAACGPFAGVFGNANATLYYMPHDTARVIKFPAPYGSGPAPYGA